MTLINKIKSNTIDEFSTNFSNIINVFQIYAKLEKNVKILETV
jgi:hypothetical protein